MSRYFMKLVLTGDRILDFYADLTYH